MELQTSPTCMDSIPDFNISFRDIYQSGGLREFILLSGVGRFLGNEVTQMCTAEPDKLNGLNMSNREKMIKPDFMSDEDWDGLKEATATLSRIKGDAKADVADYLANPEGRSTGAGPSGLPTLLLTVIGRKSGEKRTTPLVFLQHGEEMVVVGSLAGYDSHPAWVLNLNANAECQVQCDANKVMAVARDASDGDRAALWPQLTAMFPPWGYFQKQTDRPFAIKILSPTGPA